MQKTTLGISAGLLGATVYFMGLFSGYMVAVIMTGYILLFEENEWLKKSAVKTVALMIFFSFLTTAVHLIPDVMSFVSNIVALFGSSFYIASIDNVVNAIMIAISIVEKILFIGLGMKALNQRMISIPFVDSLINKYM